MKKLITDFKKALFGRAYIRDFSDRKFWPAVGYLAILALAHGFILVIFMIIGVSVFLGGVDNGDIQKAIKEYVPLDTHVVIEEGVVTNKGEQPVIIPISQIEKGKGKNSNEWEDFQNVLVIDTTAKHPLQAFEKYKTAVLVTSDKMVGIEDDGGIKIMDTDVLPDMVVTQENILKKYNTFTPIIKVGLVALPLFIWPLIAFGSVLYYLFIAILLAVIFVLIAKMKKVSVSYKKAYVISLYALTIPILADTLALFIGQGLGTLLTVLLFAVVVMVSFGEKKLETKKDK